jgi:hypothetical protein
VTERADPDRVRSRAASQRADEQHAGSDDPEVQAAAILDESEQRTLDRDAAPGARVEHRTSEDVTEPPPGGRR